MRAIENPASGEPCPARSERDKMMIGLNKNLGEFAIKIDIQTNIEFEIEKVEFQDDTYYLYDKDGNLVLMDAKEIDKIYHHGVEL